MDIDTEHQLPVFIHIWPMLTCPECGATQPVNSPPGKLMPEEKPLTQQKAYTRNDAGNSACARWKCRCGTSFMSEIVIPQVSTRMDN